MFLKFKNIIVSLGATFIGEFPMSQTNLKHKYSFIIIKFVVFPKDVMNLWLICSLCAKWNERSNVTSKERYGNLGKSSLCEGRESTFALFEMVIFMVCFYKNTLRAEIARG